MDNIDINKLYSMMAKASVCLSSNLEYLNSLNVFPVPDGDTGTNMAATLSKAVHSIDFADNMLLSDFTSRLAKGALMGARGNSGVILSQILRGFCKSLDSEDIIDSESLTRAFIGAKDMAYKSVLKPKEGTMLTVIRGIAESSERNCNIKNIPLFMDVVLEESKVVLDKTRDMLPENKAAGTVDAGGAGLIVILQAFSDELNSRVSSEVCEFNGSSTLDINFVDEHPINVDDIVFQYCTEFIVLSNVNESILRDRLCVLGDSIVVVSMDNITKVHIHTNNPGTALDIAVEYGSLTNIKIDNMKEQAEQNKSVVEKEEYLLDQAVVVISSGEGIDKMFIDSGATYVVSGGQSMNPSVEDIVAAVKKVRARNVIILPNNKNIILSAKQCADIVEENVFVVETKTIPQGLGAILSFNQGSDFECNCQEMINSYCDVISCQITSAVKDSNMNGLNIKKDDILGILEDDIVCNKQNYIDCIKELFSKCIDDEICMVTLIYGKNIDTCLKKQLSDYVESNYDDLEICFVEGLQETYPIIISFE